ncbi:MAG TPA: class I SAM-dependent methyltransferase [Allosphingosinicella sp.]
MIAPWLDRISRDMNALALACLGLERDDWVLEVGFGGGGLVRSLLLGTKGEVFAADISDALIARARDRFARDVRRGRLHLLRASAEALPLPPETVTRAVSVNSLYFWPDPAAALAELARVMKPGGRLAIVFEPAAELRKWPGHRFGFRLFEPAEVKALMEAAGFADIVERWGTGRKPARFCCFSGERAGASS